MKCIIATLALALPLAALCVLPKSASAQSVNHDSNYDRQPQVVPSTQPVNRDPNYDHRPQVAPLTQHHRKVWVAGHYVSLNHHRRWVPGQYVYK